MLSGTILLQNNERTARHVLNQLTAFADEVIVVDGGSTDATPDIARSYDNVRYFKRPFDDNFAAQRNFALAQCRGDWILSMDSDELFDPAIRRYLPCLTRIPFASYFRFPRYWLVTHNGRWMYCRSKRHYPDYQIRLFRNHPRLRYRDKKPVVHESFTRRKGLLGFKLYGIHLYHYCLLCETRDRQKKIDRYNRIERTPNPVNRVYLYEDENVPLRPLKKTPPGILIP